MVNHYRNPSQSRWAHAQLAKAAKAAKAAKRRRKRAGPPLTKDELRKLGTRQAPRTVTRDQSRPRDLGQLGGQ